MDNYERFTNALNFCSLSAVCKTCPYSLITALYQDSPTKACFESKDALLALEEWLHNTAGDDLSEEFHADDHTWLQDLIKLQFNEDDEELF